MKVEGPPLPSPGLVRVSTGTVCVLLRARPLQVEWVAGQTLLVAVVDLIDYIATATVEEIDQFASVV